jgi:hypothetical protein
MGQSQKGMGMAAGEGLIEKAMSKTFGSTIHQMTSAGLLSNSIEKRLVALLQERNWLVHKSRAGSRNAIYSDDVSALLLRRLDSICDECLALMKDLGAIAEKFVKKNGVSEGQIQEIAERLLEQWHRADAI